MYCLIVIDDVVDNKLHLIDQCSTVNSGGETPLQDLSARNQGKSEPFINLDHFHIVNIEMVN